MEKLWQATVKDVYKNGAIGKMEIVFQASNPIDYLNERVKRVISWGWINSYYENIKEVTRNERSNYIKQ